MQNKGQSNKEDLPSIGIKQRADSQTRNPKSFESSNLCENLYAAMKMKAASAIYSKNWKKKKKKKNSLSWAFNSRSTKLRKRWMGCCGVSNMNSTGKRMTFRGASFGQRVKWRISRWGRGEGGRDSRRRVAGGMKNNDVQLQQMRELAIYNK